MDNDYQLPDDELDDIFTAIEDYPDLSKRWNTFRETQDADQLIGILVDLLARHARARKPAPAKLGALIHQLEAGRIHRRAWLALAPYVDDTGKLSDARTHDLCKVFDQWLLLSQLAADDSSGMPTEIRELNESVWQWFGTKLADELSRRCEAQGVDSRPLHAMYIDPTLQRSIDAGAAVRQLLIAAEAAIAEPVADGLRPVNAGGSDALHEYDVAILRFLNRTPSIRRNVSDVLPPIGPSDRKAVARRLRKLADRTPALVDYPIGGRDGVAILPAGVEALKRLTAPR